MKPLPPPITTPLTLLETFVLCACLSKPLALTIEPTANAAERVAVEKVKQNLVARGFLAKMATGLLATPEGLAALMDTLPIEAVERGAAELTRRLTSGASTRPSKARRKSGRSRAPRARAPS